jgi:uncharacterized protein YdeI (YjbR/CyaY-like superfamily)
MRKNLAKSAISMAPIFVSESKILEFPTSESFYIWLSKNHDVETELWIKIHKVNSGLKSITAVDAIDVALCWGWIDAIRKGFDEESFLQRYTRRGPKSIWSKKNVVNVERLTVNGRMTEHGMIHVKTAKADGRWERAYGSGKNLKIPDELMEAINTEPTALKTLSELSEQNRFAMAFRMHNLKTEKGRLANIRKFVEMLKRGETIYPQKMN